MFSRCPVDKSSKIRTRAPLLASDDAMCDPMKPAPPVTKAIPVNGIRFCSFVGSGPLEAITKSIEGPYPRATCPPLHSQIPIPACLPAHRYFLGPQFWEFSLDHEFGPYREREIDSIR